MIGLNDAHPITPARREQMVALVGQALERVIDMLGPFDPTGRWCHPWSRWPMQRDGQRNRGNATPW
jgi:hypothetical protein